MRISYTFEAKIYFLSLYLGGVFILVLIYHFSSLWPNQEGTIISFQINYSTNYVWRSLWPNQVNIDVLRRKYVLLLISDTDISQEEVAILEQIYEARQHPTRQESQYEVVWLPILDPNVPMTETMQKQFDNLQATMPWYSVYHPSLIERPVIKFIKEVWNFTKKPILVVIDPQGRVASPNALHMMWIWGSIAFPFTSAREEALWKEETLRLELLVDIIDPLIVNWVSTSSQLIVSFQITLTTWSSLYQLK